MQQIREQEQVASLAPIDTQNSSTVATDPFVWWSATSPKSLEKTPGTFARNASKRPANYNANHRRKTSVRERRQVVVGLLTGTAVVGILGIGGISFARFIESTKQSQFGNTQTAFTNNTTSTSSSFTNSRAQLHLLRMELSRPLLSLKRQKRNHHQQRELSQLRNLLRELRKRHNRLRSQPSHHLRLRQHRHNIQEQ